MRQRLLALARLAQRYALAVLCFFGRHDYRARFNYHRVSMTEFDLRGGGKITVGSTWGFPESGTVKIESLVCQRCKHWRAR